MERISPSVYRQKTSSVNREIRTFSQQLNAMDIVLKGHQTTRFLMIQKQPTNSLTLEGVGPL